MPLKWIHINTEVCDPWILPIWGALNDAEMSGKAKPIAKEIKSKLGLSISTRLDMLPRIIHRINTGVNQVYEETKKHKKEHVSSLNIEGYSFNVDESLKFNLLIDIDSLLFELNSICELMRNLFFTLYTSAGMDIAKKDAGLQIKKIIEISGNSPDWFVQLDNHRNFFLHNAAPYFAVDVSEGQGKYDLLIMKENIKCFNHHEQYIALSEIAAIVEGFSNAKPIIQKHLIELFQEKL